MATQFFVIKSVDEAKREVGGLITCERVDKDGETLDYAGSKPEFEAWSMEAFNSTQTAGQDASYGNLREQHSKRTVGKFSEPLKFDDHAKTIWGCAKVVDDDVWDKVKQGIYTGFSVGGQLKGPVKQVGKSKFITIIPREVSLVDNPAVDSAHFDFVRAADGQIVKMSFTKPSLDEIVDRAIEAVEAVKAAMAEPAFAPDAVPDQGKTTSQPPEESATGAPDTQLGKHDSEPKADEKMSEKVIKTTLQEAIDDGDAPDYCNPDSDNYNEDMCQQWCEDNGIDVEEAAKWAKTKLQKTTTGALYMANVEKAARKSLADHLQGIKKLATAHKDALGDCHAEMGEKHEKAVHDLVDKAMKLAGADEQLDGEGAPEKPSGEAADTEVKAAKAQIEKLSKDVETLMTLVTKQNDDKVASEKAAADKLIADKAAAEKLEAEEKEKAAKPVVGDPSKAQQNGTSVEKAAADQKQTEELVTLAKAAWGRKDVKTENGTTMSQVAPDPKALDALYNQLTNVKAYRAAHPRS